MRALKFAVVREDPRVEARVASLVRPTSALVCASGGCTAFALQSAFPELDVELYDFNPRQLEHVERRAGAIANGELARLNIGDARPDGLSQCGDFERLFRTLRAAIAEFVAPAEALERYFDPATPLAEAHALARGWMRSPYWPSVFALTFTEALLVAMFGPDAIQHAERGSYPGWFERAFERGLLRDDGPRNPFLQHVLLSRYLPGDAPEFLTNGRRHAFRAHEGGVPDVPGLSRFGLVHLSNVFDWADESLARRWAGALRELAPGAAITLRQLNNERDWRPLFAPHFRFDDALGRELLGDERSLFYGRVEVAFRTDAP